MARKLLLGGTLGGLIVVAVLVYRESLTRSAEIQSESIPRTNREEEIVRAFFRRELADKAIAQLSLYDLQSFEDVPQPRPRLSEVVERFGEADSAEEEDLTPFGVPRRGLIYRYGRLGLIVPVGRTDGEVFWVHISAGRPTHR